MMLEKTEDNEEWVKGSDFSTFAFGINIVQYA